MKRQYALIGVLVLAFLAVGCQQEQESTKQSSLINPSTTEQKVIEPEQESEQSTETENTEDDKAGETREENTVEAQQAEAPSTQQMIDQAMVKRTSLDIEQSVSLKENMTIPAEQEGWEDRTITIYSNEQQILKMTVTEPTDGGEMTGLTSYWFDEGEVFYIQEPFASYVFHDDDLIAWMDENLNILYDDPSSDVMKERKQRLMDDMIKWLDAFHAEYK